MGWWLNQEQVMNVKDPGIIQSLKSIQPSTYDYFLLQQIRCPFSFQGEVLTFVLYFWNTWEIPWFLKKSSFSFRVSCLYPISTLTGSAFSVVLSLSRMLSGSWPRISTQLSTQSECLSEGDEVWSMVFESCEDACFILCISLCLSAFCRKLVLHEDFDLGLRLHTWSEDISDFGREN